MNLLDSIENIGCRNHITFNSLHNHHHLNDDQTPYNFHALGDWQDEGDSSPTGHLVYRCGNHDNANFVQNVEYAHQKYNVSEVLNLTGTSDNYSQGSGITEHVIDYDHLDPKAAIAEALKVLGDCQKANPPKVVLIHCDHGAHRTGAVCALWRLINAGSLDEAKKMWGSP